ncbi:MAG: bifunctional demethylmenaquinone methyltransferase/2-methoxy-6-polyprenyl-1,4-benzoquinol methylase UbiE [Ginsengibacter sp.]
MNVYPHDTVVPFKNSTENKSVQVGAMFDKIAFKYDFLNRFLSVGIDRHWRKRAIMLLKKDAPQHILDVATGTGDLAITALKMLHPAKITGIDISEGMLEIGRKKIEKNNYTGKIELLNGDSEAILFPDNTFDAVTVGFGVRNFEHLEKGLSEIMRVLKPGGKLVIAECTKPSTPVVKGFYNFYMKYITQGIGKMISKNSDAYEYLNNSVLKFPEKKEFIHILNQLNYRNAFYKTLTLGICTIYCAEK